MAVRRLLLGVDLGQTVGKAALYDLDGREVALARATNRVSSPRPRWAERDMDEVWQQVCAAVRQVLADVGGPADVVAVGVCGHNDGLYAVDDELRPVRPAILATDSRAHVESARLSDGAFGERTLALTGQLPSAASPASVLTWLRRHEPDVWARTRWVLSCKDWVRLRLTGVVATDPSEASAAFTSIGVPGQGSPGWSDAALRHLGLSDVMDRLPTIRPSTEVVGEVTAQGAADTGLRPGTPVVTGAHDVDAAAVGIGALSPGDASIMLGTYSINQVVADRPVPDHRWQARAFVQPDRWLHMSTSPAGAVALDWAVGRLGPFDADGAADPAAAVAQAQAAAGRSDAPLFLPYLYGAPFGQAVAGSWAGLRGWHERADLLHAVLEGVCFTHRLHVDVLREEFAVDRARLCGGGARSAYWSQLLADVLDLPLEVTDATEAGARGAALMAGVGTSVYADLADAGTRGVRVVRRCEPDADQVRRRARRFAPYCAATQGLDEVTAALVDPT